MANPFQTLAPYWLKRPVSRAGKTARRIAIGAVALSLTVMELGIATGSGLQQAISNKLTGLWGDIQIRSYGNPDPLKPQGITLDISTLKNIYQIKEVESIRGIALSSAMISHNNELSAILFKGIPPQYSPNQELKSGHWPRIQTTEIAVPEGLARSWDVQVGDEMTLLFSRGAERLPALRYFTISGIFYPAVEELDGQWVMGGLHGLQKWVKWDSNRVTAYEIHLTPQANTFAVASQIRQHLPHEMQAFTAKDDYPALFQWMALFDVNLALVVGVLFIVGLFNTAVVVFILLLDKVHDIGVLKSMGASNSLLRMLFVGQAAKLTAQGLLWGNAIGLSLCAVQYYGQVITLDPATYYVRFVPIAWNFGSFALANGILFFVSVATMAIPTTIIGRIQPGKTVRL